MVGRNSRAEQFMIESHRKVCVVFFFNVPRIKSASTTKAVCGRSSSVFSGFFFMCVFFFSFLFCYGNSADGTLPASNIASVISCLPGVTR